MNIKRYLVSSAAVFATFQVLDGVIHGAILGKAYAALSGLWRPNMSDKMWVMMLGSALLSLVFVYLFAERYKGKGLMEGVRFGLVISLMMAVVGILNQYVVYPVPLSLAAQWIVFGMIEYTVAGIVTAAIYRP